MWYMYIFAVRYRCLVQFLLRIKPQQKLKSLHKKARGILVVLDENDATQFYIFQQVQQSTPTVTSMSIQQRDAASRGTLARPVWASSAVVVSAELHFAAGYIRDRFRGAAGLLGFVNRHHVGQGLGRRLPALARLAQFSQGAPAAHLGASSFAKEDRVADAGIVPPNPNPPSGSWQFSRGFASDALAGTASGTDALPATIVALKNPSNVITYDEHIHERVTPGDPSKKAFAYLVLTGGRFIYASALRILALKLILSMSASRDVLAMASLEVDIASIEPSSTVTVKWRGKPVFVRHRTEADIKLANSTPMNELRDPEEDSVRVQNPEWLIVVGVCTHLGCVPLPNAGDYGGWFCPCHGSHYDISGRIRKGPAPYNLEVPQYKFTEETKLLIG